MTTLQITGAFVWGTCLLFSIAAMVRSTVMLHRLKDYDGRRFAICFLNNKIVHYERAFPVANMCGDYEVFLMGRTLTFDHVMVIQLTTRGTHKVIANCSVEPPMSLGPYAIFRITNDLGR